MPGRALQPEVVVVSAAETPERRRLARELAHRLDAPCVAAADRDRADLRLLVTDDRVELCDRTMMPGRGVSADFSTLDVRPGSPGLSRNQPIAKAMGRGSLRGRTVIDATAGMGQDAFLLACLGCDVTMIERSPIIAALLEDGLRRALADDQLSRAVGDRLRIMHADARDVLSTMALVPGGADVVYIDPMFPPKRKTSALPRKEIQLLRTVVGDDPDAAELFDLARRAAGKRIVVKRPNHAPPLDHGGARPMASYEGKLARFDVYGPRRA